MQCCNLNFVIEKGPRRTHLKLSFPRRTGTKNPKEKAHEQCSSTDCHLFHILAQNKRIRCTFHLEILNFEADRPVRTRAHRTCITAQRRRMNRRTQLRHLGRRCDIRHMVLPSLSHLFDLQTEKEKKDLIQGTVVDRRRKCFEHCLILRSRDKCPADKGH